MIEKIPVYMPAEEAKKFSFFMEHYDDFEILVERKVFEQKNAKVILYFDNLGVLQKIDRQDILFYRSKERLSPLSTELSP